MSLIEPVTLVSLDDIKRAHFIAIGGAGMSPVAHLWQRRGIIVDGCDQADSDIVDALRADGIGVAIGHSPAHLKGVDTVVVSSAVRPGNLELREAVQQGLRVWHRSAALAALMAGHRGVAVSGTHGKSTTSAMVATALRSLDPSYVIGARLADSGESWRAGRPGGVFVIEADESDGSYRQYSPEVVVLTNIEADHLDRWGTAEAYAAGFERFAGGPSVRRVVLNADDPGTQALAGRLPAENLVTFGQAAGATVRLGEMTSAGFTSSALITWPGGQARLSLGLPGPHNLYNAAAAVATAIALRELGEPVEMDDVIAGLGEYRGIERRFHRLGRVRGVTLIDDYAHHPTEIAATLAAARALVAPEGRLVACFQPHLYSRTRDFADAFGQALAGADMVYVTGIYPAREDPIPGVTGDLVAQSARRHLAARRPGSGPSVVYYAPTLDDAVAQLSAAIKTGRILDGDVVVTLGAGDVTTVGPRVLAGLGGPNDD